MCKLVFMRLLDLVLKTVGVEDGCVLYHDRNTGLVRNECQQCTPVVVVFVCEGADYCSHSRGPRSTRSWQQVVVVTRQAASSS